MGKLFISGIVAALAVAYYFGSSCDHFDPSSIKDKRVLITGASSGIGEQLAYDYAKLGAKLVLTARRENLLQAVAKKCKSLGADVVEILPSDMSKPEDRDKVIRFADKHLGGLDHLILNHALMKLAEWNGHPEDMDLLDKMMKVNFDSFVELASKALPMLSKSKGSIGVVSSIGGKMGAANNAPYIATKHALQGFFASWRQELIYNKIDVSVTLCVLGLIKTEAAVTIMNSNFKNFDYSFAAEVDDTSMAILKGVTQRKYEIYYPRLASIVACIHKFFPNFVETHFTSLLDSYK